MADEWDEARKSANESAGGGDFLKIAGGSSVVLAILGKPRHYVKSFREGEPAKTRVMINVWDFAAKALKIWDMSGMTFEHVCKLRESWDLAKWRLKIVRTGSGATDTRYAVMTIPPELTPDQQARLAKIPLKDLAKIVGAPAAGAPQRPAQRQRQAAPPPEDVDPMGAAPDDDLPPEDEHGDDGIDADADIPF